MSDAVQIAIDRLRQFEPPEGYWLAFSGGKDSQTIYHLAQASGVRFEPHYNITTADPPELLAFMKHHYPSVQRDRPEMSMWDLIPAEKYPPTRIARYCCRHLKERGGIGRTVVTGVRWAESVRRRSNRGLFEASVHGKAREMLMPESPQMGLALFEDDTTTRRMIEHCPTNGRLVLNPIIDWTDRQVWGYLRDRGILSCSLYAVGFKRLGCIGCPQQGSAGMLRDFRRWPSFRAHYVRAFDRMLQARRETGMSCTWDSGEDVMAWWTQPRRKKAT